MNNTNGTKKRKTLNLKRLTDSRVFWMILSLFAASLLWMYVTTTEGVEVQKTLTGVKIEFLGADAMRASSDLIVTEQDRTSVNLTISGTRRVLSKLTNSNVTATVNLNNVVHKNRTVIVVAVHHTYIRVNACLYKCTLNLMENRNSFA